MNLYSIIKDYPHQLIGSHSDVDVKGICNDSRYVKPGDMYVCLEGMHLDGHVFAHEAVKKGAVAVVASKPLSVPVPVVRVQDTRHALSYLSDSYSASPSSKMNIVGVTGTNGKTTTTHFLQSIYKTAGRASAVIGTIGIKTDKDYIPSRMTTPEAIDLHRTFNELMGRQVKDVALEVSSHSLVLKRVEHVNFSTAIFTNLTHEHLDFHKTMENYFLAKAHLFKLLKKQNGRPQAVINTDDPYGERLMGMVDVPAISFGLNEDADVRGYITKGSVNSTLLIICHSGHEFEMNIHLPGKFNAYNALAAAAAALAENIPPQIIIKGIEAVNSVPGRLEAVDCRQDYNIFIDFAHTPDALEKVLYTLYALPHRRIITVFGCPGDRDRSKRPIMGHIAETYSDIVVVTSDNPASEDARTITSEIVSGMKTSPVVLIDRYEAVCYALTSARKDDIVLLAGKGHETYQLTGNIYMPYSDRESVESYFSQKKQIIMPKAFRT